MKLGSATKIKYMNALNDLHSILKDGDSTVSMTDFCKKHMISKAFTTELIKGGVVKNTGSKKKSNL